MDLLELSKPHEPFADAMVSLADAETEAETETEGGSRGHSAGGAGGRAAGGPTRTRSSFHPDGGVYLSAPLLRTPPSSLAGRDTGFYLRLHVKLEGA
eukprot:COSAG03_NODE_12589_length_540_cov_1.376417_1_plen_97_part_00